MTSTRTRARMIERLREKGITNDAVLSAIASVPRHAFVEEALASRAYEDTALPLGYSQTISQPFIVARMISLLFEGRNKLGKTLEIGAGCGYQAAVLAQLSNEVFTVERIAPLFEKAKANLASIGLSRVNVHFADGQMGLADKAPFDSIIVAAAAINVPNSLLSQLAIGGRIAIPQGTNEQTLLLIERRENSFHETRLEMVRFVPLLAGTE